ncbi:MAG TPA: hypothetical protein VMK32_05805, partial [Burkholderiaceae bacterium]|nr:hypothetical protein [Burkholderiaceae bacterium]
MKQQAISVGAVAVGVALTAALSAAVAQEVSGQKGGAAAGGLKAVSVSQAQLNDASKQTAN